MSCGTPHKPWSVPDYSFEDYIFRQLQRDAQGGWQLHALNPAYPDTAIPGLESIKGVVTHKRNARLRKTVKYYGAQAAH